MTKFQETFKSLVHNFPLLLITEDTASNFITFLITEIGSSAVD